VVRSRPWCDQEHALGVVAGCARPWLRIAVGAYHRAFLGATLPPLDAACQAAGTPTARCRSLLASIPACGPERDIRRKGAIKRRHGALYLDVMKRGC